MSYIPTLYTPRLVLRPFTRSDAVRVQELAGDRRIAAVTAHIPHPYPAGVAETWIASHQPAAQMHGRFTFAITLAGTRTPGRELDLGDTGHLIGSIELRSAEDPDERAATLGYWLGVPYWNRGFVTEAARAVLAFGFERRRLHRIAACHVAQNTASGRVLQKLGMLREGVQRHAVSKWGEWQDLVHYALLGEEWEALTRRPAKSARTPAVAAHVAYA
ncbi:MAG TPA: GNAT family protein [Phycisphaerae bacterium]|jgi:RimJ/RimL family protein N-acetyltransferase|nr:GNAT family protein [Phycisphaerae bacterium]